MAIDKDPQLHTSGPEDDESAGETKKHKKKKRLPKHIVLPDIEFSEAAPEISKKGEEKKSRKKKAEATRSKQSDQPEKTAGDGSTEESDAVGAEPEEPTTTGETVDIAPDTGPSGAESPSIDAHEAVHTSHRVSERVTSVRGSDGAVEIDLHGGEAEIFLHGTPAEVLHEAVPEDAPARDRDERTAEASVRAAEASLPPMALHPELVAEATTPVRSAERPAETSAGSSEFVAGAVVGGVVGAAVGAGVEHARHTMREKKLAKANEAQVRKTESIDQEVVRMRQELTEAQEELKKTVHMVNEHEQERVTAPGRNKTALEQRLERLRKGQTAEQASQKHTQVQQAEAAKSDEQPEIAPDRRVESSAWHRIEVDKKTGQAVEDPSLAYGQEFNNEQHQEQLRKQVLEESMDSESVRKTYQSLTAAQQQVAAGQHPLGGDSLPSPQPLAAAPQAPVRPPARKRSYAPDMSAVDIGLVVVLALVVIAILAIL